MTDTLDSKSHDAETFDERLTSDTETKRELAKQFLKGEGVERDERKAVSLLEDCVGLGDADSMILLAKCCALGYGMEPNAERAKRLIFESSVNGNQTAFSFIKLINERRGKETFEVKSEHLIHQAT